MRSSSRDWENYPLSYRAREMRRLGHWIQAGESGSIVGLTGAGKSNLLGFLTHHPQALAQYLGGDAPITIPVLVDLNNLVSNDLTTFYRVMLRALFEAETQFSAVDAALPAEIEQRYRKVEAVIDPFLTQSALREVLLLLRAKSLRLVLVLDPFDSFCQTASTSVLDTLRGLRDSFKTTLSYIVGLRHELRFIRSPLELGELYEILDTHLCWLGPMEGDDARWVVQQVELATAQSFSQSQVDALIALTGGFPALLKAASLWLAQQSNPPDSTHWRAALLAETSIQNRLIDLQRGLTSEEEAVLSILQQGLDMESPTERHKSIQQIEAKYGDLLNRLQAKHLCHKTNDQWQLFSPLFDNFTAETIVAGNGRIHYVESTDLFFRGEEELLNLSEKDRRLLHHFLENPLVAHTIDSLIEAAWSEDEGDWVSDAAVQQAIRHLRKQIEPNPAKPTYLINERGAGYRFLPEGAPRG